MTKKERSSLELPSVLLDPLHIGHLLGLVEADHILTLNLLGGGLGGSHRNLLLDDLNLLVGVLHLLVSRQECLGLKKIRHAKCRQRNGKDLDGEIQHHHHDRHAVMSTLHHKRRDGSVGCKVPRQENFHCNSCKYYCNLDWISDGTSAVDSKCYGTDETCHIHLFLHGCSFLPGVVPGHRRLLVRLNHIYTTIICNSLRSILRIIDNYTLST